jgi:hypothetical protein
VAERLVALPPVIYSYQDGDMATDQECVDYARECVRLAELTKDLQLRDWLLTTAREWMATASKQKGHGST